MEIIKPFGQDLDQQCLKVTLCDNNPEVTHAWLTYFETVAAIEIVQGNLLELNRNALVSPANSFGDMGGGIDQQIDNFYRGMAQRAVRTAIADRYYGELPVGEAIIIDLKTACFPFLVSSPTMRIPGNIQGTINAYLSMRATLVAILQHNHLSSSKIQSVAIPGLGTGVGGMSGNEAAKQMYVAYDNVIGGKWKKIVYSALAPYALK